MDTPTSAETNLHKIPVRVLKAKTQQILSCMLNKPKVTMSPDGLPRSVHSQIVIHNFFTFYIRLTTFSHRDYRGLADLMHISTLSFWFKDGDYMGKLLELWGKEEDATLGKLQEFFEKIDRYDVLDDTMEMFGMFALYQLSTIFQVYNFIILFCFQ